MIARIQAWLAALGVALAAIGAVWLRGRSQGKADAQARQDADYRETRGKMDDAGKDADQLSDADIRERLRKHAGL